MANNKMLIDASHPEETRVVVVRGNRVEEFDFEAQERRQLRGNIYLAKVTRVEPSLQAAFIDYGGNRHGFLAFSEIHPDYYQIPAADRQALLEADEAEAAHAAEQDIEEESLDAAVGEGAEETSDKDDEEKPKKRGRKRTRRGSKSKKATEETENTTDDGEDTVAQEADTEAENREPSPAETPTEASAAEEADADEEVSEKADAKAKEEAEPKKTPRKRTRRPRKPKAEAEDEKSNPSDEDNAAESKDASQDDKPSAGKTMAAMMDMDSISEPADGDEAEQTDDADENTAVENETVEAEEKPAPKKKTRRTTRRKTAKKEDEDASVVKEEVTEPQDAVSDDKEPVESEATSESEEQEEPKKKRRTSRSRKSAQKAKIEQEEESSDPDDNNGSKEDEQNVESVGQEDALEEVPVRRPRRQYKIQEVIRRRQVMLVQVVKEERGNKGAALTTYLSLAGRYSVLMPNTARGGGISRKITNHSDRKRLKEIANSLDVPKGMGVILRTAGASRDKEEITRDFEYLMRLWENVRSLTLESSAPFLVYEEGSLIKRSIRDLYNKDIGEVIVAGEDGYREATEFMKMMMPEHVKNIKYYQGEQSLLARFNVENQLEKMVAPQVTLKSGGYLIINQTEALVAIDVNSGRSTREHSIEATALQTNLEAAEEVARQLRLRDLAGLVVIDFIDMEEKRNNRAVERKLKDCLKNDRARIQVGHISHFGLLEMSRQRIRASVLESTMAVCPVCEGVGHIRSESSFALHVLRSIDDHLNRHSRFNVTVKVAPATAMYIFNHKRQAVSELEDRYGVNIEFESDYHMQVHQFAIEKGEPATRAPAASKAVSPMDYSDASTESEAEDQATEDNGNDDTRSSKRGKKRRGRGRNRNKEREENNAEEVSAAGKSEVTDQEHNAADTDSKTEHSEDKTEDATVTEAPEQERKPSRGRRPRKTKTEGKEEPDTKTENRAEEVVETVKEELKEPARRTGRPGKKVKKAEPSVDADNGEVKSEDSSTGPNGAPPREVKRRNTKRVRKPKNESDAAASKEDQPTSFGDGFLS